MLTDEIRDSILLDLTAKYTVHCLKMREYAQPEAFALMDYQRESDRRGTTGPIERIWNSRNGVTPFMCGTRDGKCLMQHVNWPRDICLPSYKPPVRSRIFADVMPEDAIALALARVERYWDGEGSLPPMRGMYPSKADAVRDISLHDYESGVPPRCIEVTTELAVKRGWVRAATPVGNGRFA